jgi:hypothetical protein
MTEVSANPENKWVRIGRYLAVALTIAIVVAVSWQFRPAPKIEDPDLPDSPMGGGNLIATLDQMGEDAWSVQAGPAIVFISGRPANTFLYRMRIWPMVDDDTRMLIGALRTLQRDSQAVKDAGLSDEQTKKLNDIQPARMVVSDEDGERFEKLWHKLEQADEQGRPGAQKVVLDAMCELTERSIEPTKKAWNDAARQLQQTLTLEQLAKVAVYMQNNNIPQFGPGGGGFRGDGGGFRGDGRGGFGGGDRGFRRGGGDGRGGMR